MSALGMAIKLYRKTYCLTQDKLAKQIGISRSTIIQIEKDKDVKVTQMTLGKIEKFFEANHFKFYNYMNKGE